MIAGALTLVLVSTAFAQERPLPPVPVPSENPITEAKRVLGKVLFFDEQLSSDDTVACATCHVNSFGGTDPRRARNPGADALFNTADDVIASPGVVSMATDESYDPNDAFGLRVQVTGRTTPPSMSAMYAPELFWDGRATSRFVDPVTGATLIASGGALESQAVGPPLSSAEMAHAGRDWVQVVTKLADVVPLGLADRLPSDVATALNGDPDYATLFERAFGSPGITVGRIGMAIATYERTLLPDRTDFDRFVAGQTNALSAQERRGLGAPARGASSQSRTAHRPTARSLRTISSGRSRWPTARAVASRRRGRRSRTLRPAPTSISSGGSRTRRMSGALRSRPQRASPRLRCV